ncbi:MAG: UDP-N-acetylmuramoyl-L-alanine--D-glutamate ligase [Patescibacteria group bacterium]|nr:UDP-N-acetylmuramoyl-L-alanine--D-glutamate ligase [Patescibacteria group bacterium]
MTDISFKNKKVTVMGIGLHGGGVSMIKWLVKQGAKVIATDKRSEDDLKASIKEIKKLKNVTVVTEQHRMEDFTNVDMVVKNPAIPWSNKYIKMAIEHQVPVEMDSSLFFKLCESNNIIGITGTKGKTTTSALISKMFKYEGLDVVDVGIGQEPVMTKLEAITKKTWVVFEMSSWRCSALSRIEKSPHISLVTNIYQDHLNYYDSLDDYISDKRNVLLFQKKDDISIFNFDDEMSKVLFEDAKGETIFFSLSPDPSAICSFIREGQIHLKKDEKITAVMPTSEIVIKGSHNLYNACAMCAVGLSIGVSLESMKKTLKKFTGVVHRFETIDNIDGRKFINDATATTPESAIAGINSVIGQIHLICGGSDKNLVLDNFAKKISETKNIKGIYLLKGTATAKLFKKIDEHGGIDKVLNTYDNIEQAVFDAFQKTQNGDTILLSPGLASFGMFANEFERGEKFINAVEKIRGANTK